MTAIEELRSTDTMLTVRQLSAASPGVEQVLHDIQRLARTVFEPEVPESEYPSRPPSARQLQLEDWNQRLQHPDARMFYAAASPSTTPTASGMQQHNNNLYTNLDADLVESQIAGFFFAHPRALFLSTFNLGAGNRGLEPRQCYHIYLAAVHPHQRGTGLFTLLLDATKAKAKESGYRSLSISTVPLRFPKMWQILSAPTSGWEIMEEVTVETESGGVDRKVVMRMPI